VRQPLLFQGFEQQADGLIRIPVGTGRIVRRGWRRRGGTTLGFECLTGLLQRLLLFFELLLATDEFRLATTQVFGKLGSLSRHQAVGDLSAGQDVRVVVRLPFLVVGELVAGGRFIDVGADRVQPGLGMRWIETTNGAAPRGGCGRTFFGRPVRAWLVASHAA